MQLDLDAVLVGGLAVYYADPPVSYRREDTVCEGSFNYRRSAIPDVMASSGIGGGAVHDRDTSVQSPRRSAPAEGRLGRT